MHYSAALFLHDSTCDTTDIYIVSPSALNHGSTGNLNDKDGYAGKASFYSPNLAVIAI
jgi:hypothetical protein